MSVAILSIYKRIVINKVFIARIIRWIDINDLLCETGCILW